MVVSLLVMMVKLRTLCCPLVVIAPFLSDFFHKRIHLGRICTENIIFFHKKNCKRKSVFFSKNLQHPRTKIRQVSPPPPPRSILMGRYLTSVNRLMFSIKLLKSLPKLLVGSTGPYTDALIGYFIIHHQKRLF